MEQKTKVTLQHTVNEREYTLVLAPDAPLADVYGALYAMMSHVLTIINSHHANMAAPEEKKEDGQVSPD